VLKDGSFADQPGSSQRETGLRSVSSTNGEAKPDVERKSEKVVVEQDRVPEANAEMKAEPGTSSQWPPNRTILFPKLDHPVSLGLG
jgi:hypothetical protein